MSIAARKVADAVAIASAQALTDTRKGAGVAWACFRGTFTLNASSNATISNSALNAMSVIDMYLTSPAGSALAVDYKQTASAGQVVIQGVSSAGANITTDQSTFAYVAWTPLFHGDQTSAVATADPFNPSATTTTVTAATAVDLPTSIALANQIKHAFNMHLADAVSHLAADTTNPVATADAVDLPSVEALLNACKTAFNAHIALASCHVFTDTINTVGTANAVDQTTSNALANALKAALNAHMASAPTGESVTMLAQ